MKAIITAKILAIDYYTMKRISFQKEFTAEGEKFVDTMTKPMKVNGKKLTIPSVKVTAFDHANKWLGEQNHLLQDMIDDVARELHCILDWKIISVNNIDDQNHSLVIAPVVHKKTETEQVDEIVSAIEVYRKKKFDQSFRDDFEATYTRMRDSFKGLSVLKRIEITMSAMGVGYEVGINILKKITESFDKKNMDKLENFRKKEEQKLIEK